MSQTDGARRLITVLVDGQYGAKPYHDEAPIVDALPKLEYTDLYSIEEGETINRTARAQIRYLAALFPNLTLKKVAEKIHDILNNTHIDVDDIRLILQARSLRDPSHVTREIPFEKIQLVGNCLAKGMSARTTAITVGISLETVLNIDHLLGIMDARRSNLISLACDALRDGESIRKFAERVGEPKSTAHRIMQEARGVLSELGEMIPQEAE